MLSTRSGWRRLIHFFKPKSELLLSLLTLPFLSQWDVDFIVARQNRFIQKFARTPSAPWPAVLLFFPAPTALRRLTNKCITDPMTDAVPLFVSFFNVLYFSLSLSTFTCVRCTVFSLLYPYLYISISQQVLIPRSLNHTDASERQLVREEQQLSLSFGILRDFTMQLPCNEPSAISSAS